MASDRAGRELRILLKEKLEQQGHQIIDLGTHTDDSVDYPDFSNALAATIKSGDADWGILCCGSGIGIAMQANRYSFLRAAPCQTPEIAAATRAHNNANVLCLGSRFIDVPTAEKILNIFMETGYDGNRHDQRVMKLTKGC